MAERAFIAGSFISTLTGTNDRSACTDRDVASAGQDVGRSRYLPWTVAEVIRVTERTDGVRLGELLATLEPDKQAREEALNGLLDSRPGGGALIAKAARDLARWLIDA